MKAIKFSEKELEFLRQQYQDELESAQEYVEQINDILNKLGVRAKSIKEEPKEKEPKQYKKRGPKPKVKVIEPKGPPKKRGRKPKIVIQAVEHTPIPAPKPEKKAEPEKKKVAAKVKVGKKVVHKATPLKKSLAKVEPATKSLTTFEKQTSKKEIKKVFKKKPNKKRRVKGLVTLKPLSKKLPVLKSEPEPEPAPFAEPIITTIEETKE